MSYVTGIGAWPFDDIVATVAQTVQAPPKLTPIKLTPINLLPPEIQLGIAVAQRLIPKPKPQPGTNTISQADQQAYDAQMAAAAQQAQYGKQPDYGAGAGTPAYGTPGYPSPGGGALATGETQILGMSPVMAAGVGVGVLALGFLAYKVLVK